MRWLIQFEDGKKEDGINPAQVAFETRAKATAAVCIYTPKFEPICLYAGSEQRAEICVNGKSIVYDIEIGDRFNLVKKTYFAMESGKNCVTSKLMFVTILDSAQGRGVLCYGWQCDDKGECIEPFGFEPPKVSFKERQ